VTANLITGADFGQMLRGFERVARRLETRDYYAGEEEPLRRFLAGEPDDLAWRTDWLDGTVRPAIRAGKRFGRVRVVPEELTAFLRHELAQCEHNVAVGEDIRYLVRDEANALDLPDHDFWVFDDERVALLYFTADDRLLGAQIVTEPAVVAAHVHWLDLATRHARPYQQYVAEDPSRVRPPG